MADINELIKKKLEELPPNISELATEAIKLSERGLSEISIAEQLSNVVRRIVRTKGESE
jgi:malate/lactate dehydrogenase